MSANTKIEWADHTFNPWIGCTKVSPACDHCYAEADFGHRRKVVQWGAGQPRKHTAPSTWAQPVRWNAEAQRLGVRYRVFCASLADVFDNAVSPQWRTDLFALIAATPHLDWLLLTKRIGNVLPMMKDAMVETASEHGQSRWPGLAYWIGRWWDGRPPANVWLGATITSQTEAERDIPKLLAVPAVKRFLSMEPLLGPVDISALTTGCPNDKEDCCGGPCQIDALYGSISCPACEGPETIYQGLDWVIVGGESGPNARPMHPDWARSLRDQCQAAGVPFLFKQWGEWVPYEDSAQPPFKWSQHGHEIDGHVLPDFESEDGQRQREWHCDWSDMLLARRVGKKAAGRLLDGVEHNGVPA